MNIVTMNIIEQAMVSICRQMGITLMKTSYSTIFNEALDFTCGLCSPSGDMISVAEFNPAHIGAINILMRSCLQEISEDIEPGDVVLHNDPYRGGLHTPEHTFYKPIFVDGELMGFSVAIGHIAEIGGLVPGAFASEATEIFHEGIRVPPVRIIRRGEDVPDIWKLLLAGVRTPRQNYGDYRALVSAVDIGERELERLIRKYGKDVFRQTIADLQDYSEARMRAELSELKDGRYVFEDIMEDDGTGVGPFTIHVECFIDGNEIVVDFTGSSPQAVGPINATLGVTHSATYNALFHLTDPSIPKNAGCFRPIRIVAPPGTIVNVDYPAPSVGGNTESHPRIAYTIIGALAACSGDRAFAADGGSHSNFVFGGTDAQGDYFACYDLMVAGWGGRSYADGNSATNVINGNNRMTPTEVFETRYPWFVERFELVPGSGGAGQHRGGLGTTKTLRCDNPNITVSFFADRQQRGPWGVRGGKAGGTGSIRFQRAGGDWMPMHEAFGKRSQSKFAAVAVKEGDRVHLTTPGAGGWGDSARRGKSQNPGHHGRQHPRLRPLLHHDTRRAWFLDAGQRRLWFHHVPDRPAERHGGAWHCAGDRDQHSGHLYAALLHEAATGRRVSEVTRNWSRHGWNVAAALVVAFWLLPIAWVLLTAIKPTDDINSPVPIFIGFSPTFEHFSELFTRFEFSRIIWNNLLIVPPATAITIVLAVMSSYALARLPVRGADHIAFFILSLRFMPGMVVVLPYYLMFQGVGLIDTHLGMIVVYVAFGLPFAVWLLRSFLLEVPKELEEAALLDGLGHFAMLWRIVIPLIRPGIAVATIFTFIFTWNEYLFALALTFDRAVTLPVQISKMIDAYSVLWGPLSAAVVLQLLPMLFAVFLLQRHIVRGLALGAVK